MRKYFKEDWMQEYNILENIDSAEGPYYNPSSPAPLTLPPRFAQPCLSPQVKVSDADIEQSWIVRVTI